MEIIISAGVTIAAVSAACFFYKRKAKKSPTLSYHFSRTSHSIKNELFKIIDDTNETLDVAIFLLTEQDFVSHLCQATERGVRVRVISDRKKSVEEMQRANMKKLIDCGVPVKVNNYDGNMHLKFMISDKQVVSAGSYNWTHSAEQRNDEVVLIIRDKKMAREWHHVFDQKWKDLKQYSSFNFYAYKKGA
ncbi:phospholipase D-like domain-containing protein [Halobacillus sp. Marseille-Q1614]|uniref:phospholipase D-like domain-containing protein n=1 Tax=Halobacillus sp. Marseille-Q1614 TaxID=2709134 RepID=UPI00156FE7F9|nr:phospholipase D-like domain-containing protein [Halobacillus sp. Marseille-Q1614]